MDIYFIPYKKSGGCVVDWDFQSIIHCLKWHNHDGYTETIIPIKNSSKCIYMHRLIMRFPKEVDHIDGKRNNNREKNLRSVTRRKNLQNRYEHRNGKLVGATFDKHANKWKAALWINGKNKHIKNCDTELEAHLAYKKYLEVNEMVKLWISVQMDATMKHDLDDHCKDNNISRSDLIRDFIENLLYTKET